MWMDGSIDGMKVVAKGTRDYKTQPETGPMLVNHQ
jgi:hypothetical protein